MRKILNGTSKNSEAGFPLSRECQEYVIFMRFAL